MLPRSLCSFAFLALLGCSDDAEGPAYPPVAGCESIDPAPCEVLSRTCQLRLHRMAACLRGEDGGEAPPVEVISEDEYADYLSSFFEPRPVPDHEEEALVLFDSVEPGGLSPEARIEENAAFYAGFYSRETKAITLITHDPPLDGARASVLLVHELVHALQDREVDLGALIQTFSTTGDASVATRSLFEGEATLHQSRYAISAMGIDPDLEARFESAVAKDEASYLASPSPYLSAVRAFPYAWGTRYVHQVWRDGGIDAVSDLYAAPPSSTAMLMASVDEPAPAFSPTRPAAPTAPAEWSAHATQTLGGLSLFLVLAAAGEIERARELALGWRGDTFTIFSEVDGEGTAAVWRIEVASADVAADVVTLLDGSVADGTLVTAARTNTRRSLAWAFPP